MAQSEVAINSMDSDDSETGLPEPSGSERRKVQRQPADTIARAILKLDGHAIPATIWDISISGLGVLVDSPLAPGAELTLNSRDGRKPIVKMVVKHQRPF